MKDAGTGRRGDTEIITASPRHPVSVSSLILVVGASYRSRTGVSALATPCLEPTGPTMRNEVVKESVRHAVASGPDPLPSPLMGDADPTLSRRVGILTGCRWSGRRDSNSRDEFGRLACFQLHHSRKTLPIFDCRLPIAHCFWNLR